MSRALFFRCSMIGLVLLFFAAYAPMVGAQGPTPTGTYNINFFNYVVDEGGAACPTSGAIAGGTDSATGTFHFWREGTAPYPGVNVNNYSACWDGQITFPSNNNWFVQASNDDGMDVWVDGNVVLRSWYDQGPTIQTGNFSIDPTVSHHVVIKYYNRTLGGTMCVGWAVQGNSVSYWNCPNAQTTSYVPAPYAPVYTQPSIQLNTQQCNTQYQLGNGTTAYIPCLPGLNANVQLPNVVIVVPPNGLSGLNGYGMLTPNGLTGLNGYSTLASNLQPTVPTGFCRYIVRRGDTLSGIAIRHRTTSWVLATVNRLVNPSLIYAGMSLYVPNCY